MAAPVFFVDPGTEPDSTGRVSVTGEEARHAAQVLRLRVGERVDVVDGEGRRYAGTVHDVSRERLEIAVVHDVREPEPTPRVTVVQALAKGDRGEQSVAAMTEVGVDVIVPWSAEHCVSRWSGERAQKGVDKWRTTARSAAKQARRSRVPDVRPLHATADLEELIAASDLVLCLDESAEDAVAAIAVPETGDIVLIVGPEGGLSPAERARLCGWGARLVRLGPSVLRTSTAGPVGAAVVLSRTPRWGASA